VDPCHWQALQQSRRGHNRTVVEGGRKLFEELPDPAEKSSGQWLVI
jgi:hypothetical protein